MKHVKYLISWRLRDRLIQGQFFVFFLLFFASFFTTILFTIVTCIIFFVFGFLFLPLFFFLFCFQNFISIMYLLVKLVH